MILQEVLTAAGKEGVLGSLEDNDPDADDEEELGEDDGAADDIAAKLSATAL